MFLTYVIKVDKREVLMLYFKDIHVVLVFSVYPEENYPYTVKMNNFGSYTLFDPLDQATFKMFLTYVIKVDKREVLTLYFKDIHVVLVFSVYPDRGKFPLYSQNEQFCVISIF